MKIKNKKKEKRRKKEKKAKIDSVSSLSWRKKEKVILRSLIETGK
jgi:hypothetical protein